MMFITVHDLGLSVHNQACLGTQTQILTTAYRWLWGARSLLSSIGHY